jgi:hypothetical protein
VEGSFGDSFQVHFLFVGTVSRPNKLYSLGLEVAAQRNDAIQIVSPDNQDMLIALSRGKNI